MESPVYLIKDIARMSRLSIHTIKFYLRCGLIKETGRSPETSFRYFDDSTLERLEMIKTHRRRGLSLKKISALVKTQ